MRCSSVANGPNQAEGLAVRPSTLTRRKASIGGAVAAAFLPFAFVPGRSAEPVSPGQRLFDSYCSACHQYDDQGMGEAPPLDGSPWVVGPPERLVLIILHGVKGKIEVRGRVYNREMPGFAGSLDDGEIAALASYARKRFGASRPVVEPLDVERIRRRHVGRSGYWEAAALLRSIPDE
ncbi:MAG: cytochrome c [Bryobacterales bacterium]|nr:cytochrome c [Bryobacterales bacterium]